MTRKTILMLGAAAMIAATAIAASAHDDGRARGGPGHMMQGEHAPGMPGHGGPGMKRRGAGGPMGMADSPVFGAFDTDTDGTVSAAEAEAGLAGLLTAHDADGDGSLSRDEFDAVFAAFTRHRAARPFAMLDADENGQIDADEIRFPAEMMARRERMHDALPDAGGARQ